MVEFKLYIEGWWTVLHLEQVYVFGNRTDQRISCDWIRVSNSLRNLTQIHIQIKVAKNCYFSPQFSFVVVVQSLSCVWLFATPQTVAHQASSVHGIFQARILEWVAISSSRGSSQSRGWTQVSFISSTDSQILLPLSHMGNLIRVYWTKLNPGKLVLPCVL